MFAASESAFGVSSAMTHTLQIAKSDASGNLCSPHEALSDAALQNARMDERKNGGPNHLQAWREYRRMSQEELGEKVGTTGSVISLLESGERGLSAKWLRKLAPALNTSPGHLLDHDPNMVDTDLLELWAYAPSTQKRQLVDIAKTLVKTGTKG